MNFGAAFCIETGKCHCRLVLFIFIYNVRITGNQRVLSACWPGIIATRGGVAQERACEVNISIFSVCLNNYENGILGTGCFVRQQIFFPLYICCCFVHFF